ncbi:Inhibitor of nuclear factor kappa-B kinase subunit epsilon [Dirofilaria immitis]|nr:Inhibitor of nuclear factor kappa-B kinase subunit epsilon [Dirofilaria immitis]
MDGVSEGMEYANKFFWLQRSIDLIGNGAFGKVHKGRNQETGEFVAIKTCNKINNQQHVREIEILQQMDSPYVDMNEPQQMVLIMELADGSVRDELKKLENMFGLPYQILLQLIDHLEKGLSYLNSRKIAHRDVKPENLLIFNKSGRMTFKLCDFGGSRFLTDNFQPLHSICGTLGYLNEYSTANLARQTTALSYTKDECDLWSVGCTLFECATGILPFVPAKGPGDTLGMYNMMISRPSDAIFGRVDEMGQFLWQKIFRMDVVYIRSELFFSLYLLLIWTFRRILTEFIRHLFDRREATRLTFNKFDEMCKEMLNLKRMRVFKMNIMRLEEYFDTSSVDHFERSYFDVYVKADMPTCDLICLLTLPAGSAIVYKSSPFPISLIDCSSDIIIMGLRYNESYTLPIELPDLVAHSPFPQCNHEPTLHEMKLTAANTLNVERQTYELHDTVLDVTRILRAVYAKLLREAQILTHDCDFASRLAKQLRLLSKAIALSKETIEERRAVENNAHSVVRELNFIGEAVKWICSMLQQIDVRIAVVESKHITKEPSLKVELEAVVKLRTCSPCNHASESILLMETDRKYLLNSYEKAVRNYDEKLKELHDIFMEPLQMIARDMFDLSHKLFKTKKQLEETLQLITITEQTNEFRLEAAQIANGDSKSVVSNSVIKEFELHARQQKINAANSLALTKEWLLDMES